MKRLLKAFAVVLSAALVAAGALALRYYLSYLVSRPFLNTPRA